MGRCCIPAIVCHNLLSRKRSNKKGVRITRLSSEKITTGLEARKIPWFFGFQEPYQKSWPFFLSTSRKRTSKSDRAALSEVNGHYGSKQRWCRSRGLLFNASLRHHSRSNTCFHCDETDTERLKRYSMAIFALSQKCGPALGTNRTNFK